MTDVTSPRPFIGIQPCRVADTRGNGAPIQGGIFANSQQRTWDITNICGIPAGADAISVNFTVVSTAATPAGAFLLAWPTGQAAPPTAIMTYGPGVTILSNAAIVPLGPGEQLNVNVSHSTHVIMDVNGYFSDFLGNPANFFEIYNNSNGWSINSENASLTCLGDCGIASEIFSNAGASAISGSASGDTGLNYGVLGRTTSSTAETAGVYGHAVVTGAQTFGVHGHDMSSHAMAAGVHGTATAAAANGGSFLNSGIGSSADTFLATRVSAIDYGLTTGARIRGGSLDIVGAPKNFVSPHPDDPGLEIRYASVEAPTVDVYFRGTASLSRGYVRIPIPEHFRLTARDGTYMTTLTPVGRPIPLSVESESAEGIVVRGAGDTAFHYVVYAERAEIEGFEPVSRNRSFTPEILEKCGGPSILPDSTRRLLMRNGTLREDGSYNPETARAQGWTIPERASRPAPPQQP